MAAFVPSGSISVSADGLTQIFNDTSNYTNNSDSVTLASLISRVLTVYNPDGSVFLTGTFNPVSLIYSVPVTKDLALSYQVVFTLANSTTRTLTVSFISTQLYNLLQRTLANNLNCTCAKKSGLCSNMAMARELANAALTSNLLGDNVTAQTDIDAATVFLNTKSNCSC